MIETILEIGIGTAVPVSYFSVGWAFMRSNMKDAWERATKDWTTEEYQVEQVFWESMRILCFWPPILVYRGISNKFHGVLHEHNPKRLMLEQKVLKENQRKLDEKIEAQKKYIKELEESELGIKAVDLLDGLDEDQNQLDNDKKKIKEVYKKHASIEDYMREAEFWETYARARRRG